MWPEFNSITATSLEPVMVTVTVSVSLPPLSSAMVTSKLTVVVSPVARLWKSDPGL